MAWWWMSRPRKRLARPKRQAAQAMIERTIRKTGATVGADKGYDVVEFIEALREQGVTPPVA